ncbi:hypothetical protein F0L74_19590 [Chitinophaga agrisoli]|uniref:Uncharacterized protein n=1 Tax=Chitinophaga agrisoli TaxID=2607653 RepID=A0A5B2VFT3_9BACT|nr:hypothetical protein [Chitinophaga agrisoli]KAA2238433.1 hypothetical protein F0L74_19590 [Chitinophaga agrisoli]
MSTDFAQIFNQLIEQVTTLAKNTVKDYTDAAVTDGKQFLQESQEKLQRWTTLLANHQLTTQDFTWLVQSQKDLAQMEALKQAGLAMARIDAFKASMLTLIIDTVFSILKVA